MRSKYIILALILLGLTGYVLLNEMEKDSKLSHIETGTNAEPEDVVASFPFQVKCSTDEDCDRTLKTPNSPAGFWECSTCPGGKMVFPYGIRGRRESPVIIQAPSDYGFCIQRHVKNEGWKHYYGLGGVGGLNYCIYEWNGQEYVSLRDAQSELESWKDILILHNISETFIENNIAIVSVEKLDENNTRIRYLYNVDWFQRGDSYLMPRDNIPFSEVHSVIPKKDAVKKLKSECSSKLELGEHQGAFGFSARGFVNGNPSLKMHGTISFKENRCVSGWIDLTTGEILRCQETRCWVT